MNDQPLPEKAFSGDYKNAFILSIVRETDKCAWLLENSEFFEASKTLSVLLDRLELGSEDKELLKLRHTFRNENLGTIHNSVNGAELIRAAFRQVSHYLSGTYFKEKGFFGVDPNAEVKQL